MEVAKTTVIANTYGFHARPSTSFSKLAGQFASKITVRANGMEGDGKSVMGLMSLGAPKGTEIEIVANGDDAQAAVDALIAHVDDQFGGID